MMSFLEVFQNKQDNKLASGMKKSSVFLLYPKFLLFSGFAPEFYCVGEYLPDRIEGVKSNGGPMDGLWHDSFYWTLRDILLYDNTDIGRLKAGIDCRQQGFLGVTNVVNYIGNHDHDRMLVEMGK